MQALEDALGDQDVSVRLGAISKFSTVPVKSREALFKKVAADFNHTAREAAANQIELCPAAFGQYLSDPDPEVRIATVNHSVKTREAPTAPANIITRLAELQKDSSPAVRCALARVLPAHAALPPKDGKASTTEIVSLVSELLKDKDDDVRIVASVDLKELTIQFGYDFIFENFHGAIHTVISDVQWRVRVNGMDFLFGLGLLCNSDFFNQNLMDFLVAFLKDPCLPISRSAVDALPSLTKHFGDDWLKTQLMPKLEELAVSNKFLQRATYLCAIAALVSFFPVQYQTNYVFQPMIRMLRDQVTNVVLLAIELIDANKGSIHPFRRQYELKPILEQLAQSPQPTIKERATSLLTALLAMCQE
jgi:hypothetical protein